MNNTVIPYKRHQRIIIFGAGELGQLLIARLAERHTLTVLDSSDEKFAEIRQKYDINTIHGELNVATIRQANAHPADLLIAVSGDEHANLVACQLAKAMGVKYTICRLYSDFFQVGGAEAEEGKEAESPVTPENFGVTRSFSSPKECARKLLDVAGRPLILEEVHLSREDVVMVNCVLHGDSPLCDLKMSSLATAMGAYEARESIPEGEILNHIRIAAILHGNTLYFPNGRTTFRDLDRLYVCGEKKYLDHFLLFAQGRRDPSRPYVVISGTGIISRIVVTELLRRKAQVHVIAADELRVEEFLREIPPGAVMHVGSVNDEEVLQEAGIGNCDSFIAADSNEAENLMGGILARRLGAGKVIAVTYKPEYIGIVPELPAIDCPFNSTQISANMVLRIMNCGLNSIDSRLQMSDAFLGEFEIGPHSKWIGKALRDCMLPENLVLALLFRGEEVFAPNGRTVLAAGDKVAAIVRNSSEDSIRRLLG